MNNNTSIQKENSHYLNNSQVRNGTFINQYMQNTTQNMKSFSPHQQILSPQIMSSINSIMLNCGIQSPKSLQKQINEQQQTFSSKLQYSHNFNNNQHNIQYSTSKYDSQRIKYDSPKNKSKVGTKATIKNKSTRFFDLKYDLLKIPPDWKLAKQHALSRETKPEQGTEDVQDICQCCGYELNRKPINLMVNLKDLGFLGAGFPLYFNYIRFCILMLIIHFLIQGIPNIVINSKGHFCYSTAEEAHQIQEHEKEHHDPKYKPPCTYNGIVIHSVANLLDNYEEADHGTYFSVAAMVIQLILSSIFRKEQRVLEAEIDDQNLTPSDFSIMVNNIPKGLENPKEALKELFQNSVAWNHKLQVTKVVLVYDIEQKEHLEKQIQAKIKEKKKILLKNFNLQNPQILKINEEIKALERKFEDIDQQIQNSRDSFKGIAFISFETNTQKDLVLMSNPINKLQRFLNYFKQGKSPQYSISSVYFYDRHLYIEQAPEPNDIDWEYIHCDTVDKIKARLFSNLKQFGLTFFTFSIIAVISWYQSQMIDHAYENHDNLDSIIAISYVISIIIVFFNKFCVPYIIHHIVEGEKWSNKTKLNKSFAIKLTLILFANTALITFSVEIIFNKNYYGIGGGMVFSEYFVFVLNAFIPPLAWLVDPWSIIKNYQRRKELQKADQSTLTQQEANILMEHPDYAMGKRYADLMKTMWFTFFYSPVIPFGTLWSIIGLTLYYFTDKYNLIYRRTVKENIGKQLTLDMIDLTDYCVAFHCFGNFFFKGQLFGEFELINIICFIISIIINLFPAQKINEWMFPIDNENQTESYSKNELLFDTDYDRENPILRKKALQRFFQEREIQKKIKSYKLIQ